MKILIGREYLKEIIPLVQSAESNIDILMYHWGYYSSNSKCEIQKLTLAIRVAATRGVKVRILIHSGSPNDNLRRKNSETVAHLGAGGAHVKYYKSSGTLHSKLILIDKTYAALGSHNFSKKSMGGNIETSILVEGSADIRRLCDYFINLWGQN